MPNTSGRSRYSQKPVQQNKTPQPKPPSTPDGALSQLAEDKENPDKPMPDQPVMETKETPDTDAPVVEAETKQTTSQNSSQSPDFYYDEYGRRVIRMGRPVTVHAVEVNNVMVVQEDVVMETLLPGALHRTSNYLLFFKGQEVAPNDLRLMKAKSA